MEGFEEMTKEKTSFELCEEWLESTDIEFYIEDHGEGPSLIVEDGRVYVIENEVIPRIWADGKDVEIWIDFAKDGSFVELTGQEK